MNLTLPLRLVATENKGKQNHPRSPFFMHFPKKLFKQLLWLLLAGYAIYVLWGRRFLDARRYRQSVRAQREHLEVKVKQYRLQAAKKRYFIRKLMTDADFREQVLREQIDYVGENEHVIYFTEGERLSDREERKKF